MAGTRSCVLTKRLVNDRNAVRLHLGSLPGSRRNTQEYPKNDTVFVLGDQFKTSTLGALLNAGADESSAVAAARIMMDAFPPWHRQPWGAFGFALCQGNEGQACAPRPKFQTPRTVATSAMLDANDGLGHAAEYSEMGLACAIARETGIGAVGIIPSSHSSAVGTYALLGAGAGMM